MVNLKNQRAGYKGGLSILKRQVENVDISTMTLLSYTLLNDRLKDSRQKLEQNHFALLEELTDQGEVDDHVKNQTEVEETLWSLQEVLIKAYEGVSADIKKMYLFVNMHPEDRNFQRVLWRETNDKPIQVYRLKKVTFGTASAPFQAIRTLHKLAEDYATEFPEAVRALKGDFYVDDAMTGANTVDEALTLQQQLLSLTSKAKFMLRKWSSSHPQLLETLHPDLRETQIPLSMDKDVTTKALGLLWNPTTDEFQFQYQPSSTKKVTKRSILSEMARVFDPLGFLSPITIKAKMLMQTMWKEETSWDSSPSTKVLQEWQLYLQDLSRIHQVKVPRGINCAGVCSYQLHLFSDASEKAFAAAAYLRVISPVGVQTRLIAGKTKVAPVKPVTLPRLELCGAVLAARLSLAIQSTLTISLDSVTAWTDSTITLSWIRSDANRWNTFERNRVITIQSAIPPELWHHVPGLQNPADLPTRGTTVTDITESKFWFCGPAFLQSPIPEPKPKGAKQVYSEPPTGSVAMLTTVRGLSPSQEKINCILQRYSSWLQLRKHLAWLKRCWSWSSYRINKNSFSLTPGEITQAEQGIIKFLQQLHFLKEIVCLKTKTPLPPKSPVLSLSPFRDDHGIICVGGRLDRADLPYNHKHPILLPRHHVTLLIVKWYHEELIHGGVRVMAALIQRKYWIIRGRRLIKKVISSCKACAIAKAQPIHQLMSDLPGPRVTMSRPFTHVGVDFAGPLVLRVSIGRSPKTHRAWVAVFICFSTKAVNLELVSSLSTEAFLATLRFISRRGRPTTIYSDNGKNFEGAKNELELLHHLSERENQHRISMGASAKGIEWRFNPPAAPHMEGLWEAAVKSAKHHLHRVMGKTPLTYEEYGTLLKEVEACPNSRPLCPQSSQPDELEALTPGHFLIGGPLIPGWENDLQEEKVNRLTRWQRQQQLVQHFWRRWKEEYLQQLQVRTKWKSAQENVKEGDLVVIREENTPPQKWRLARVLKTYTDPNEERQLVRSVLLKTAEGTFKRPIVKLVVLPTSPDTDNDEE